MRPTALTDDDLATLEGMLDALPAPLEPLDASMLDGYLVGVLLQPERVPDTQWLAHVHDADGRPAPVGLDLSALHALVQQRYGELNRAIAARHWFDPWVFELDDEAPVSAAVLPWAAGFALAMDLFPDFMRLPAAHTLEGLALIYAHFDSEDLEDADELLAEIEGLEPAADLKEAVEDLVTSTLRLADVSRPLPVAPSPTKARRSPPRRR